MKKWQLLALLTTGHACEHWFQGVLGPVIPYLTADLGLTLTQVGLLFTGRAVMSALSSVGTGYVIDSYGGGKWLLVGCMASVGLFYGGASLATGFLTLAPIIWLSGLATHIWHPPSMGLLGMRFEGRKGFALGVHGTGANLGQTLAPIIAGYLLLVMTWRGVLLANTIPLFLTAMLLWVFLEPFQISGKRKPDSAITPGNSVNALIKNPGMMGACVFSGVRTLAHNIVSIFLPILLVRKYGVGPSTLGIALGVYSAASIFPETIVGYLSDRISRKLILFIGTAAGGVALFLVPYAGTGIFLYVCIAAVGVFLISMRSVIFAYGFEVSPPRLAGSVVGVIFTANQIFVGLGLFFLGILADAYGLEFVFGAIGIACLGSLVAFSWLPGTKGDSALHQAAADPGDPMR
ncbi:MAG: MFS transporter [Nitrospinae bacterium]|nr:MFS transporter [Nitrospinota bacterium]